MDRAQARQFFLVAGGLVGEVVDRVVLDDPVARHVLGLGLGVAPGRDLHKDGHGLGRLDAHLEPPPGLLRMGLVGGRIGQQRHFLVQPAHPIGAVDLGAQFGVQLAQIGHVAERVFELFLAQGAARPIGEARSLVEVGIEQLLDQHAVARRLAEAAHHGRELGVEDGVGNGAREVVDDLDVLAGGVEHLEHPLIAHQLEEGRQVELGGERVDDDLGLAAGHLNEAETGPEGRFAHELGVDRDKIGLGQTLTFLR